MTIRISLQDELEKQVREVVESGQYDSASEVVREALRFFFNKTDDVLDDEVLQYWLAPRLQAMNAGTAELSDYDSKAMARRRRKIINQLQEE